MAEDQTHYRSLQISRDQVDETARTIDISAASAQPYERWDGLETLEISDTAIVWDRLKNAAPLLLEHDVRKQIGVIEESRIEGGKLRVVVRFGKSALAEEIFRDVIEGIRRNVSIGYLVHDELREKGANGAPDKYTATRWEPMEVSIVPIPADNSVGVGRSAGVDTSANRMADPIKPVTEPAAPAAPAAAVKVELNESEKRALRQSATNDTREILAISRSAGFTDAEADAFLEAGKSVDEVRKLGFKKLSERKPGGEIEIVREPGDAPKQKGSIGEQFIRSEAFKREAVNTGHRRSVGMDCDISVIGIRGKVALATRAGFNSSDLTSINVAPQQGIVALGVQRLTILDLIAPGTTSAAAIPYPRENSFTPAAGMVGERGLKPNWDPDITTETASVKKVAVTTKVPDEFMADFPGMRSFIDERLPYMVDVQTEAQVLYGDGLGNNLKGIASTAGIQTRAYATAWGDTIYKALTDIRVGSFFEPDGIAMHPYDWEVARLEKDLNGQYLAGGPYYIPYGNGVFMEMNTFWGKPVAITTSVAVGKPIVGAWKLGAQYFVREGMRVEATNSNEDDFLRNLMALRAEHRLALAVYRPVSFLEVTGGPARS